MTTQLHLVDLDSIPVQEPSEARASERARRTSTAGNVRPLSQPRWLQLDEKTCERGLIGVANARAALREANRRAARREAERRAREAAESPAEVVTLPGHPHGPDGHAAA